MKNEDFSKLNSKIEKSTYLNRELSWLSFNQRVLEECVRPRTPLLESVRFLSIAYSNLDEFFMVRVAGKKRALRAGLISSDDPDSPPLQLTLQEISHQAHDLTEKIYETFSDHVRVNLEKHSIRIREFSQLEPTTKAFASEYFQTQVLPILTPLAVDPAHPFPFLANRRLYLLVTFVSAHHRQQMPPIAFVEVPSILPRLVKLPLTEHRHEYLLLENLIAEHLDQLFFGIPILSHFPLRVTRNLDINLMEHDVTDLMSSIQSEVIAREQAEVVRLEVAIGLNKDLESFIQKKLQLDAMDLYYSKGPLAIADLQMLYELPVPEWKFNAFKPRIPDYLKESCYVFDILKDQSILLHHPYDSFQTVIDFLQTAAYDPQVLAIKQTLYRTSGDSPIIEALIQAARLGKQVTAVVELKARFDENNNISWARRMEQAGVHVVYGFIGLKTHCKMSLIVRREEDSIRRYVHLSTGNYNANTARSYVDLGYITSDLGFTNDTNVLFNLLTGFNILSQSESNLRPQVSPLERLIVAPLEIRDFIIRKIDQEINSQHAHRNGFIFVKINALADQVLIDKLYQASNAGVKVKLIVRGICCLRPGIKGLSENIEVTSIIGRFLEHSRVFLFFNNGSNDIYIGSADWMRRNMDRRIEIIFPIHDSPSKNRILSEIIPTYLKDTENSWNLLSNGTYVRHCGENDSFDCHQQFIEIAKESGLKSLSYEKTISHNPDNGERLLQKRANVKKRQKIKD